MFITVLSYRTSFVLQSHNFPYRINTKLKIESTNAIYFCIEMEITEKEITKKCMIY